jgi:hypothetical protein
MAYTDIDKPTDYFNTVTWTGDDTTSRAISGVGFQPDWTWIKGRSLSVSHLLQDAVRGTGGSYTLKSDSNDTDGTNTQGNVSAFSSDGFTVAEGSDGDHTRAVNNGSETYVGWNWLGANGTASNTDGSITSTVSANTTSGFSIVSYSGTGSNLDFGHGLGAVPDWFMIKNRDVDQAWRVYHKSIGFTKRLVLSETGAESASAVGLNGSPSSSLIYLDTSTDCTNASGQDYICYAFAEKKGFSKFGSYTGNGNADGTFVYTGFRPAFVMFKSTSTTGGWEIHDNKRDTFNPSSKRLFPHLSNAEATEDYVDFVSNGFKFRTTDATGNTSGTSYIYMAFAENPFVTSSGVCATAR